MTNPLLSAFRLRNLELKNRAVMAPMTRSRSPSSVPAEYVATYYAQRAADAGLLITEGTSPSPNGLGYPRIPGLFNGAQVQGWRRVTDAVHQKGGRIFLQMMHTGRVGHEKNLPAGAHLLAPSAGEVPGQSVWVDALGATAPLSLAKEMTEEDIETTIAEHVTSAKLAMEAGFDGVELHGANGYLLEQFLNSTSNRRTDAWGGSAEKRTRFGFEIAKRTAEAIGGDKVGIRLSPYGVNAGMSPDPEVETSYPLFAAKMKEAGLVYVHIADHSALGAPAVSESVKSAIRARFGGTVILGGGFDVASAEAAIGAGKADLVAFGRGYLANPDYVARTLAGRPLNAPDFGTFYTPGEKGYTDYV